jgi:tetratricopeptide (TPR) repeat protein
LTYLALGKYDLALAELGKAVAVSPADYMNLRARGDIYLYMDDLSRTEEEYRKLLAREEADGRAWGWLRCADLYALQARFGEAKEQERKAIEYGTKLGQNRWLRTFRIVLSYLERKSGHPDAALQELDKAWTSAVAEEDFRSQRDILLAQGLTYLEKKAVAEAHDIAARLKAAVDQAPNKRLVCYYHFLMGMIELEKKDFSRAVELFKLGLPLLNVDDEEHFLFADALGTAFYEAGDLEKARREYERIISLGTGRLSYGDIYARSYFWLAKISEKQGNKFEAEGHYRKFLGLWKDADPGRPEVEDARKRLAGLKN